MQVGDAALDHRRRLQLHDALVGIPFVGFVEERSGVRREALDHRRIEDHPGTVAEGRHGGIGPTQVAEQRGLAGGPGHPRGDGDVVATQPTWRPPPDPALEHVVERLLRRDRQLEPAGGVPGHLAHADVRPPSPGLALRQSEVASASGDRWRHPTGELGQQRRGDVLRTAQVGPGHRTVEGDVVTERRRRLVGDPDAADVHQQRDVEAVPDVLVVEIHPAGEGGGDHTAPHRRPRRKTEAQIGHERQPPQQVGETQPAGHGRQR